MRAVFLLLILSLSAQAQNLCQDSLAKLVIVSGPSGAGKTTVLRKVLETNPNVRTAVAVTTRAARPGETNDKDYHFWKKEDFEKAVKNGDFLEWTEVHGNFYGTLKSEVEPFIKNGTSVILVIDVQGAAKIRKIYPDNTSVFLKTSSEKTFED